MNIINFITIIIVFIYLFEGPLWPYSYLPALAKNVGFRALRKCKSDASDAPGASYIEPVCVWGGHDDDDDASGSGGGGD